MGGGMGTGDHVPAGRQPRDTSLQKRTLLGVQGLPHSSDRGKALNLEHLSHKGTSSVPQRGLLTSRGRRTLSPGSGNRAPHRGDPEETPSVSQQQLPVQVLGGLPTEPQHFPPMPPEFGHVPSASLLQGEPRCRKTGTLRGSWPPQGPLFYSSLNLIRCFQGNFAL